VADARRAIPGADFSLPAPETRRHPLDFLRAASDDRRQQSTETLERPVRIFAGYWYGWQTTPGNDGVPHFAPIRICTAKLDLLERTAVELNLLLRVEWLHEYADVTCPVTAAFAGAPVPVSPSLAQVCSATLSPSTWASIRRSTTARRSSCATTASSWQQQQRRERRRAAHLAGPEVAEHCAITA
jgi:hypothetical protein